MRERVPILLGVFSVMALSNAIVPVLPSFAASATWQSAIYAAYFLGAFLFVLPAGIASDRIGQTSLIQAGLVLTLASGFAMAFAPSAWIVIAARGLEGVGAGLFIASAMSFVNSRPDHARFSGFFMAALNLGLLLGLLVSGAIANLYGPIQGIIVFTGMAAIPFALSAFLPKGIPPQQARHNILAVGATYLWLYLSSVVLIGATGVVTALYPGYSGLEPAVIGLDIAWMNLATIVAVLIASRLVLPPLPTLRATAVLMAVAVLICAVHPIGFVAVGTIAGVVMIAQMAYLAGTGQSQGILMGFFNAASYAGMSALPFAAGVIADTAGYFTAFAAAAVLAALMALTIGRCPCR
jgi:MFS family permease